MGGLTKAEYMEDVETRKEILDLKAAENSCRKGGVLTLMVTGKPKWRGKTLFSTAKKRAKSAIGYLENARLHGQVFMRLAVRIDEELNKGGAEKMMIDEAGRIIGTAKYIDTHINQHIAKLNRVVTFAESYEIPKFSGIKRKVTAPVIVVSTVANNMQQTSGILSSIADSIAEDVKWLQKALRIEKMLEQQTPKNA